MSRIYRTARGKQLDVNVLLSKNEKTPAVGNMKVNARGDLIDYNGQVLIPVNERVSQSYAHTVGNKSAQVKTAPAKSELTPDEIQLTEEMEDDIEIEEIKKKNG
jgi:hypothetical protein